MGLFDRFTRKKALSSVNTGGSGGWSSIIHEPFTGAWQLNQELTREDMNAFHAVFACVTLIAQDISKLSVNLKKQENGIWANTQHLDFGFLKRPNHFQTWQQFCEAWVLSKLLRGNTYIWKKRRKYGQIDSLHVLNPDLVTPLVDDDGSVYYQIRTDKLAGQGEQNVILPASEVIHDRWNCFYHPLVGLSPLMACSISAKQGISIQQNSSAFFGNMSRPSGILTAPGHISKEAATELKTRWNEEYSGNKIGFTAVMGDGLTYNPISMSAQDAQMLEQLKYSAQVVCSVFKVHPFQIGLGEIPAGQKVADIYDMYHAVCLQPIMEAIENLLDYDTGAMAKEYCIEFDIDSLIRMDKMSQMDIFDKGSQRGLFTINEVRQKLGLVPVEGGNTPYLQQQNFSLTALAKRDSQADPFSKGGSNASNTRASEVTPPL